jgi:hypothetical protein
MQKNVQICFTSSDVLASLYKSRPYPSKVTALVERAVKDALPLLAPEIVYQWMETVSVKEPFVRLSCPRKKELVFCLGKHAGKLKKANTCLVAVWTIGPGIDEKIDGFNQQGDAFTAYVYNAIGLVALDKTYEAVKQMAGCRAKENNWGVSPLFSPGSIANWRLSEQQLLCTFLETEKYNIRLNSSHVLVPFKSASGLFGIGPGYDKNDQGAMCQLCVRNKACSVKRQEE